MSIWALLDICTVFLHKLLYITNCYINFRFSYTSSRHKITFETWFLDQPNNLNGKAGCACMSTVFWKFGYWDSKDCNSKNNGALCQKQNIPLNNKRVRFEPVNLIRPQRPTRRTTVRHQRTFRKRGTCNY